MSAFLEVDGLVKNFGGVRALDGFELTLEKGDLLAIIGPNGCGKTTLFNLVTGAISPSAGDIRLEGRSLVGLKPHQIARLGVQRKFQVPGVYWGMSVEENLEVARFAAGGGRDAETTRLLELARLGDRRTVSAGALGHGERQWLEIAMVLATAPRLVLLDEPTTGMTLAETAETAELVKTLRAESAATVIVIEHDMAFVEALEAPILVMREGKVARRGGFAEIRADPLVREIYLGDPGGDPGGDAGGDAGGEAGGDAGGEAGAC